jgi:drug/metabolite transporter superfamily protein YnfA
MQRRVNVVPHDGSPLHRAVAGSLVWAMVVDKFRPDRWEITGAVICLLGVAVLMYAPRAT